MEEAGSEQKLAPRAGSKTRRRAFPGAASPRPMPELPDVPLPPKPEQTGEVVVSPNAPVVLVPVGSIKTDFFNLVEDAVREVFNRTIQIGEPLPMPKYAYNPTREQYHSSAILKRVETVRNPSWDVALGITEADLFVPEVPFIFGEADRSTRSALISVRRIRPEHGLDVRRELFARRFISEVVHQLGLLRGLAHCPNNRCVMFDATVVNEIDKRGSSLCANCRKRLAVCP